MPSLPTDALPAAEFIVRHMHRTVDLADGVQFSAVSETEKPVDGDNWFWTDDNAKVLEFMSRPELWTRFPKETAEILCFVQAMCRPPFIFRRLSTPRLTPADIEGPIGGYRHSMMNIRYDLSRGGVAAGMRFHDERNFENVLLYGNSVEFTYRRRQFKLPVETAISDTDATQNGHVLELRHSGDLYFTPKQQPLRLGRITYLYRIDARSMLFEVEASLDIAAIDVSDVVLTVGHDQLGQRFYGTVDADTRPTAAPLFNAGKPGRTMVGVAGASYYVIRHGPFSGDALALHSVPREPARLSEIEVIGEIPGRLQRAIARYSFPGHQHGARLVAAEHKLLTGGGFYDRIADYAEFMRDAVGANATRQAVYDFSISYDYGVVINAFAKCFASSAAMQSQAEAGALRAELQSLIDTYLSYYLEITIAGHRQGRNTVFSRELAFVILGVVTMYRTTGAAKYLEYLSPLCDALLDLEMAFTDAGGDPASGFIMKIDASPFIAHVDCHSAALLALTQAAQLIRDERLVTAIDRGLAAYCLETSVVELGGPHRVDSVGTLLIDRDGARRTENSFWNFKAGLTLRLFAALRNAAEPVLQQIAARHSDRIELFEMILRRQLEQAITEHGDAVEIRCSTLSSETNSETQPWVMLGLLGHPAD
jgi:hypothetical protein